MFVLPLADGAVWWLVSSRNFAERSTRTQGGDLGPGYALKRIPG
jgi:hypothetical protein